MTDQPHPSSQHPTYESDADAAVPAAQQTAPGASQNRPPVGQPQPMPQPLPPAAYAPQQPSGFKRGFGLGAGAGLGLGAAALAVSLVGGLLSMSMMVATAGMLSGVGQTSIEPIKTVWGPEKATSKLRAISVSGPIMAESGDGMGLQLGSYGYEIAQVLDKLEAKDADGVVLLMNTPGGTINGSKAIADAVDRYEQRTGKKAYAYVQGMSASGGMYAMSSASKVLADHGSLIGSIGVISGPFERYKDVKATTGSLLTPGVVTEGGITSEYLTQGKGKDFGNPYRDMSEEEKATFVKGLANEYNEFVAAVSKGRNIPAETIKNEYGAYLFDTKTAQQNKLIDGIAGRDEAFRQFATESGLDPAQTKVVAPEAPGPWAQLFGAQSRVYGTAPAAPSLAGQAPQATTTLCNGSVSVLAYAGSTKAVCG